MTIKVTNPPKIVTKHDLSRKFLRLEVTFEDLCPNCNHGDGDRAVTVNGILYDGHYIHYPSTPYRGRKGRASTWRSTSGTTAMSKALMEFVEQKWPELCIEAFGPREEKE